MGKALAYLEKLNRSTSPVEPVVIQKNDPILKKSFLERSGISRERFAQMTQGEVLAVLRAMNATL